MELLGGGEEQGAGGKGRIWRRDLRAKPSAIVSHLPQRGCVHQMDEASGNRNALGQLDRRPRNRDMD